MSDKENGELAYWDKCFENEGGKLGNSHYEYFFTEFFNYSPLDYTNKVVVDIGCGPRLSLEWAKMSTRSIGIDPLADRYINSYYPDWDHNNPPMEMINSRVEDMSDVLAPK